MKEKRNFNDWNVQSDIGILVEILFLLKKWIRTFLALILYFLVTLSWQHYAWIGLGFVIGIILVLLFGYLSYKNTLYKIDTEKNEFLLKKGIFNKTNVSIQLDKIIQVNINQNVIQKLVNVYSVEIETAGSVKSEATLKALDKEVAFDLKERILIFKNEAKSVETINHLSEIHQTEEKKKIQISILQLVKYAFTADYFRSIMIMFGIILSFFSRIVEYFGDYFYYSDKEIESAAIEFFQNNVFVLYFLAMAFIAIFVNAIRMIFRYFNMEIALEKATTWITFGFFARKNTVLQNERTQIFYLSSNPIQRKLNIRKVNVTQISSDIEKDKKAKISIVGLNEEQMQEIFSSIFSREIPKLNSFSLKANIRLLIIPIFFLLLIPLSLSLTFAKVEMIEWQTWIIFSAIYIPLFWLLSKYYWKNYSLYFENGFLIKRTKLWTESLQITDVQNIQSVHVSQYFWQEKTNIGNLSIHTAGGQIRFSAMNIEEICRLANYILFRLECV